MVRVISAGVAIRIKISNLYGTAPLTMSGATVAKAATEAAIRPTTLRPATFSLRPDAIVPAGQELVSDPIPLPVQELIRLAHARGIRIVGGTIMPFEGNQWSYPDGTPEPFALEQIRDQVNSWIRASGEYDAVADFERALLSEHVLACVSGADERSRAPSRTTPPRRCAPPPACRRCAWRCATVSTGRPGPPTASGRSAA
ncbi:hypothetical protein [Nonomuraea sp. bgisy101]|uniref:hypothetical protein n=1 Tax=Nonomuraea sp. bgisy101 TaxID=3413784 RepID=UPI003D72DA57